MAFYLINVSLFLVYHKAKVAPDVINFDSKKFDRMGLGKNESLKDKILKSPIEKLQKETLLQTLYVIYTFE
jgi:hypothetical protein